MCLMAGGDRQIQRLAWRSRLVSIALSDSQLFFAIGAIVLFLERMAIVGTRQAAIPTI
jgi:hypothetical protein